MAENKERLLNQTSEKPKQVETGIIDIKPDKGTVPREVESWFEKIEKTNYANDTTVVDDTTGQTVLSPSAPVDPQIVLPITRKAFSGGFNKTVSDAGRWLSEFVFRIIKIKKGKVKFNQE